MAAWAANLLTLGGFIVVVTVYVVSSRNSSQILENKLQVIDATLEDFNEEMKKLREVVGLIAVQNERLGALDQRMLAQGRRVDRIEQVLFKMPKGED